MSCPSGQPPELTLTRVLEAFLPEYLHGHSVPAHQLNVLRRLGRCRSVQLGWTVWHCQHCQRSHWRPNGCGDRHCPSCQHQHRHQWLRQQRAALLPVRYFHWVFTLPAALRPLALQVGDPLLFDPRSGYILERLPKAEVEDLLLEEVPAIAYADIGGLAKQIEQIQDALELPYAYADYFREHQLAPPKGVLLYGPPGCGKTLIAKAVANSLAKRLAERTGREVKGYFLNVKGPELLNKYVGETERKIREIFARAREKASAGFPVVVFFDEMESLFRTRGSGISSDIEATIVPQFLAELDGVEGLSNVIVIGASNRQDLIDPAVLRPGRFDVKIKIDRPGEAAARDIFSKYLTADLPLAEAELAQHAGDRPAAVAALIAAATAALFATTEAHRFLEITYASGDKETLYFKDFASGALIEGVCTRAKKLAVKRMISTGQKGLTAHDLLAAVQEEFQANEDLPNTTNPDDWAKIAGRRGERIVHVRQITDREGKKARKVDTLSPGHYL